MASCWRSGGWTRTGRPVGSYRRTSDLRVSTTDPDATPMRTGAGTRLGYHDHYVVDGGKARIILAALVTPADVMENVPMRDLLWRVCFRRKLRPRQVTGDTTYGTVRSLWRSLHDLPDRPVLRHVEAQPGIGGPTPGARVGPPLHNPSRGWASSRSRAAYLNPTTIQSGPARCSTVVSLNPASPIHDRQSAPV